MDDQKQELIQLCGLWKNEKGTCISGNFTFGSRVVIFPNGHKRNEKDPDYVLYIQKSPPKEKRGPEPDKTPF